MYKILQSSLFITLFLHIFSGFGIAQNYDYPKLVLNKYSLPIPIPLNPTINITYELAGESRQKYKKYIEKYEELKKEFEEKAKDLEDEYNAASGETKIEKARALIELVLHYRQLFDELQYFDLGKFRGDYEISLLYNNPMINVDVNAKGIGEIELSGEGLDTLVNFSRKIHGHVDGQSNYKLSVGGSIFNIEGSGNFSDSISGYYIWDLVYVKQKSYTTDGLATITGGIPNFVNLGGEIKIVDNESTGWFAMNGPGVLVYVELDQGQTKGDAYFYDDEFNFYNVASVSNPRVKEDYFFYYTMQLIEPELDEIPFQELIDKYYTFYVTSLNVERKKMYLGTNSLETQAEIATRTLNDMIDAYFMAERIGVSPGIRTALLLILNFKDSLVDVWFNLAFLSEESVILDRLSHAGTSDQKDTFYLKRINNALKYVNNGEMVASEELLYALGLYPQSAYLSKIIIEYFRFAQPIKCLLSIPVYEQWITSMFMVSQIYAESYVSNEIRNSNCN